MPAATRRRPVSATSSPRAPGRRVGIFGFKLTFSTSLAVEVLTVEIAAVVLLATAGALIWRQAARRR